MPIYTPLPPDFIKELTRRLFIMRHPTRLRILMFLDSYGAKPSHCICEKSDIKYQYVSRSLRNLCDAGVVKTYKIGTLVYYRLQDKLITDILFYIRKLFGYVSNDFRYVVDRDYKPLLPKEFMMMVGRQIRYFSGHEKFRVLEYMFVHGIGRAAEISQALGRPQTLVSQYLRELQDKSVAKHCERTSPPCYKLQPGVHMVILKNIHKDYHFQNKN